MEQKSIYPVLVVDNEPTLIDILKRAASIEFPEAQFIEAGSFDEAAMYLEGLTIIGPRLILLDIDLGTRLNGLDVLKLLRSHPQGRLLPVIILSSNKKQEAIEEAYWLGANAYTIKPFSFEDWKTYVQQLRTIWYMLSQTPNLYFTS